MRRRGARPPGQPAPEPWDAGLQPERTTLAWVRTALTLAVVSLLTARLAAGSGPAALVVGLGGTGTAAALVWVQRRRHYRRDTRLRTQVALVPAFPAVLGATLLTLGLAAAALTLVLLPVLAAGSPP